MRVKYRLKILPNISWIYSVVMRKILFVLMFVVGVAFESSGQTSRGASSGNITVDDALIAKILGLKSDEIHGNGVCGYYENNGITIRHGKLVLSVPGGKILGEYSDGSKVGTWTLNVDDVSSVLTFSHDKITGPVSVDYSENRLSGNMKDNHWIGNVTAQEVVDGINIQYSLSFNSTGQADGIWKISRSDGSVTEYDFFNGVLMSISEHPSSPAKTGYALDEALKKLIIDSGTSSEFSDATGTHYRLDYAETINYNYTGHNIGQPFNCKIFNRLLTLNDKCFMKLINLTQQLAKKQEIEKQKQAAAVEQERLRQQQIQKENRLREEARLKQQTENLYCIEEEVVEEVIPFQLVEVKPSFMGGDANTFSKWVAERLVYPETAKENGLQGSVTLQFTVETDGSITNVNVLRAVAPELAREAVRIVSSSPKWTPGKQDGRVVRVQYTFPVAFKLP